MACPVLRSWAVAAFPGECLGVVAFSSPNQCAHNRFISLGAALLRLAVQDIPIPFFEELRIGDDWSVRIERTVKKFQNMR